jgi:HK97 family phage major capsid protein
MSLLHDLPHQKSRTRRYSLLRAIRSCCEHDATVPVDGIEAEVHQELARRIPSERRLRGFLVPGDIACGPERRALDLGQGAGSIMTVVRDTAIDALRSKLILAAAGAVIGDLSEDVPGNVALPRLSSTSAATWVGDGSAPSESNPTVDQVLLQAHTCTCYTDLTRRMIKSGTPAFQDLVLLPDLMRTIAHEVDRAGLNGSGQNNVPLGLLQHANVETVAITADAGNGGAIAHGDLVNMELTVAKKDADAAADSRPCFVASPQLRAKLRNTEAGSGNSGLKLWRDGKVLDYPALSSTSIPANLTKGGGSSLSAVIFGCFADLVVNTFSALDVLVNPYLQSVSGVVRVSVFLDVDIAPRHVQSFCKIVGAST